MFSYARMKLKCFIYFDRAFATKWALDYNFYVSFFLISSVVVLTLVYVATVLSILVIHCQLTGRGDSKEIG